MLETNTLERIEVQEETTIKPVQIVTVKAIHPLYKDDEPAERIELIELEEVGFNLVAGKGLYSVGDNAIYIQPDYCVSDIPLFESFIKPINRKTELPDENLSMLGKVGGQPRRIRAKKFNLSKVPNGEPVYSNGILLPMGEVIEYLETLPEYSDYDRYGLPIDNAEVLGITKYEAPEDNSGGGVNSSGKSKPWMDNVYKTDEPNIHNLWNKIEFPVTLVGTEKIDGSSITLGMMDLEEVICSRNIRKSTTLKKHIGRRNKTIIEKLCFWKTPDLNVYNEVPNTDDDFVKYGSKYSNILCDLLQNDILLRGELNGSHLKGSGNKNNPSRSEQPNIKFFGMDVINEAGFAIKVEHQVFCEYLDYLNMIQDDVKFERVKEVFNQEFSSKDELINVCNYYFKDNMIEGIVVRTLDSKFSAKVMNDEYDSKK